MDPGHGAVLVGGRNPVAGDTGVGDRFVAHDGDKSWEGSNYTYMSSRALHAQLILPPGVDLYEMPSATIRGVGAGKGQKQVSLYAFTCRGV